MNLSDDRRARIGVRTIPKKRQIDEDKVDSSLDTNCTLTRMRSAKYLWLSIEPKNRHDKRLFHRLFERVRGMFVLNRNAKFPADSACDA